MSFEEITALSCRMKKLCRRFGVSVRISEDFIEFNANTESDADDIVAYMKPLGYRISGPWQYGRGIVCITFSSGRH
jgi:hypothetical protein